MTLVAHFQTDGSVTFDRLADPHETSAYDAEFLSVDIHLHGRLPIVVSVLAENVEGKRMTREHFNRLRDALNVELAKYGHAPLPPDAFSMLIRNV